MTDAVLPWVRADATAREPWRVEDETTRYLCSAAHLDQEFADNAIRETLVEPTRAVPPTPGVDLPAVLREAVAARTRRWVRDALLFACLVGLVYTSTHLFAFWLLLAVAWSYLSPRHAAGQRSTLLREWGGVVKLQAVRRIRRWALWLWVLLFLSLAVPMLTPLLGGRRASTPELADTGSLPWLFVLIALVVLLLDEFVVAALLTRSFRRGPGFQAGEVRATWPGERLVRTLALPWRRKALKRLTGTQPDPELLVYRGYHPFVGAGIPVRPWSIALPLDPKDEGGSTQRFTLTDLYDHVTTELARLGASASLSPERRLGELTARNQVVVSAETLLDNIHDDRACWVLPDVDEPPVRTLTPEQVAELRERPLEWMRYYRCFQVETWDRNLVVSVYLHLGADDRMLYLEWTPCVLMPVAEHYRIADRRPSSTWSPVRHALAGLLSLPVTTPRRVRGLFRRLRPLPQPPGLLVPDKYGAATSLRELATDDEGFDNYFQRKDVDRYLQLLERRAFRAIGEFLTGRGISVVEFQARANQVINNHITNTGGTLNMVTGGTVSGIMAGQIDGGVKM
ncbi:hypothetical protein JOF53_004933 [Crossiella equi]|uniref:Uncharacterized protein n=1 Tax=Crossiella equi TaxID=130796 RepID=A0ABS5AI74_9PSEU|nr:hypothetical protein [Crossiella equi]MBP2476061.1 hypothetical protein [Crossiella equi]